MAKLTRKKQKIFGSTGDTSQFGQIGSDAAGTPTTTKDIDTIQSLAQYLSGLYAITGNLNEPPRGQDINALYHLITRQLAYLFEAGVPEWEAATEYSSLTSLVLHGGSVWLSLSNTNIGNTPALGSAHWRKVIDQYGTARESVSTTSRIFDLTGDRVPPIPDDPAGVTYQNIQNFTSFPAGWNPDNTPTITYTGGRMRVVADGDFEGLFRLNTSGLCTVRLRVISGTVLVQYLDGQSVTITKAGGSFNNYSVYSASNGVFRIISGAGTAEYEIEAIYVGTGAYLSKTVDRAGVPWTNFGALPVDGPFGKGLQFNGAQYLQAPGPMIGASQGTLAVIMRRGRSSVGTVEIPVSNHDTATRGVYFRIDGSNNGLTFAARTVAGGANNVVILSSYTDTTNIKKFVVTWSGLTVKTYVDGVLATTATLSEPIIQGGDFTVGKSLVTGDFWFVGEVYHTSGYSRVWTDEEIARWSRDPYSEESVPFSTAPSINSIALRDAAGRMQAASGSASLDVVNKGQLDTKVSKAGDSMTGNLAMGGNKVTGLAASSSNGDAVRHEQLAALDAAVMKLSGNQTAAGIKTFSSIPVLPASDPTTDNQAARKAYVDTKFPTSSLGIGWGTVLAAALGAGGASLLTLSLLGSGWLNRLFYQESNTLHADLVTEDYVFQAIAPFLSVGQKRKASGSFAYRSGTSNALLIISYVEKISTTQIRAVGMRESDRRVSQYLFTKGNTDPAERNISISW